MVEPQEDLQQRVRGWRQRLALQQVGAGQQVGAASQQLDLQQRDFLQRG